jgi:uncharacterized protein YjlB
MYRQAHYHSTTHECLGVFAGTNARIRLGVSDKEDPSLGVKEVLNAGDVRARRSS